VEVHGSGNHYQEREHGRIDGRIDVRGVLVQEEARCGRGAKGGEAAAASLCRGGAMNCAKDGEGLGWVGGGPKDGEEEKGIVLGLGVWTFGLHRLDDLTGWRRST
jgi:hypothetical protein